MATDEVSVNHIIKRLQDIMASNNNELKKAIGGAIDLETVLDRTSIEPMSFHVAYIGSSPVQQFVKTGEPQAEIKDNFGVYVVIDVTKFNGRSAQAMIPAIKEQLIFALWGWEYSSSHYPFTFDGDNVEYFDRGRYIHVFNFGSEYRIDGSDKYQEGNLTPFDSLYSDWIMGKDEDGNIIKKDLDIINIYNNGDPLV